MWINDVDSHSRCGHGRLRWLYNASGRNHYSVIISMSRVTMPVTILHGSLAFLDRLSIEGFGVIECL